MSPSAVLSAGLLGAAPERPVRPTRPDRGHCSTDGPQERIVPGGVVLRPTREEGTRLRVFPPPEGIAGAGLAWPDCLRVFAPGESNW